MHSTTHMDGMRTYFFFFFFFFAFYLVGYLIEGEHSKVYAREMELSKY